MAASRKETGWFVVAAVPALGGLVVLVWLFWQLLPPSGQAPADWRTLAKLAAAVGLAFAVTAVLRFALAPLGAALAIQPAQPNPLADADAGMRGRIAPLVLAVGSAAIIMLALGLIVAFSDLAQQNSQAGQEIARKLDTLLVGVFSAVLPVFATWVGTVIAFYFTNESFRQAAQSAREAAAVGVPVPKAADIMIRYDKIAKIEIKRADARSIKMEDVLRLFNAQTSRVVVFDETKQPVFILRRSEPPMPQGWVNTDGTPAGAAGKTVDDYLKERGGENAKDAAQFGSIAQSATLDEARTAMITARTDVFVTASGQKADPVLGWITDGMLKDQRLK